MNNGLAHNSSFMVLYSTNTEHFTYISPFWYNYTYVQGLTVAMITPVTFIKEIHQELKQVVWPKKEEVIKLTTIVIVVSIIVGLYIGGLDFAFTKSVAFLLK